MNEYMDECYTVAVLWDELARMRPIVVSAEATINALEGLDPAADVETDAGRMVPAIWFLRRAHDDMLNANDIAAIEWAIWWRTYDTDPHSDPARFATMFGHLP